jgi:hypothetical protein
MSAESKNFRFHPSAFILVFSHLASEALYYDQRLILVSSDLFVAIAIQRLVGSRTHLNRFLGGSQKDCPDSKTNGLKFNRKLSPEEDQHKANRRLKIVGAIS